MKYYVKIDPSVNFPQVWEDARTPRIAYTFNEQDIHSCHMDEFGDFYSTYDTLIVSENETFSYLCYDENGKQESFELQSGEYGKRVDSLESMSQSISEIEFLSR